MTLLSNTLMLAPFIKESVSKEIKGRLDTEALARHLYKKHKAKKELENNSKEVEKTSGFMRDAGRWALNQVKRAPAVAISAIKNIPQNVSDLRNLAATEFRNAGNFKADMLTSPVQTAKAGFNRYTQDWKNMHPAYKAIDIGQTGWGLYNAAKAEDPSGMGRSRAQRLMSVAAGQAGSMAGGAHGMAGQAIGRTLAEKAVNTPFDIARQARAPLQPQYQYQDFNTQPQYR